MRKVLAYYEEQTEDDALIEDEAGMESSETVMNVPHDDAGDRVSAIGCIIAWSARKIDLAILRRSDAYDE